MLCDVSWHLGTDTRYTLQREQRAKGNTVEISYLGLRQGGGRRFFHLVHVVVDWRMLQL